MIDIFGFELSTTEISIIITILGVIILYFGKLISEAKPQKEERISTYIQGFVYIFVYMGVPAICVYTIFSQDYLVNWFVILSLLLQYMIISLLKRKYQGLQLVSRLGLEKRTKKEILRRSKNLISKTILKKIKGIESQIYNKSNYFEQLFLKPLKVNNALIVNIITIFVSTIVFMEPVGLIYKYFTFLLSFLIISHVAFLLNSKKPWKAEIVFNEESVIGYINKIDDNYVTLLKDEFIYFINKDKIKMIKSQLYDKKKLDKVIKE
jgi:hypothetical protein